MTFIPGGDLFDEFYFLNLQIHIVTQCHGKSNWQRQLNKKFSAKIE